MDAESRVDWAAAVAHPSLKRSGREHRGPCPVSGDGKDRFWVNQEETRIGCRGCGDASGKLTGDDFRAHVEAIGAWKDPAPKPKPRRKRTAPPKKPAYAEKSWTFTTAAGVERRQFRGKRGGMYWDRPADPEAPEPPPPGELLYLPEPLAAGDTRPIYLTEGASDADAMKGAGFFAAGRPGGCRTPKEESLQRFTTQRQIRVVPDCDPAGRQQAMSWAEACRGIGLDVVLVDLPKLKPGAPRGFDVRDWLNGLPPESKAEELLDGALETLPEPDPEPLMVPDGLLGAKAALEHIGIDLRFNELTGRDEWKRGEGGWLLREDGWESHTRMEVERHCVKKYGKCQRPAMLSRQAFGSAVEAGAWNNKQNPFLLWLEALPPWDGTPRLSGWMGHAWDTRGNPRELVEWASAAPLIACVQRQLQPGFKHDECVILQGKQGLGKSSAIRGLTPDPDEWFGENLPLAGDDKTRIESLLGRVVVECPDMQGLRRMGKGGVETLKAFMSRRVDQCRLAYRRNPENFPRRCVIFGTANDRECLLSDSSGVRRFVVIRVAAARPVEDLMAWMEKHRDQLWAEALHRRREASWLDPAMRVVNEKHSGEHRPHDAAAEEAVARVMECVPEDADGNPEPFDLRVVIRKAFDSDESARTHALGRGYLGICQELRMLGFDNPSAWNREQKRTVRLWQRAPGAPPPRPEPEPEDGPEPEPESPKCRVCGCVFLPKDDGVMDLCHGCRKG